MDTAVISIDEWTTIDEFPSKLWLSDITVSGDGIQDNALALVWCFQSNYCKYINIDHLDRQSPTSLKNERVMQGLNNLLFTVSPSFYVNVYTNLSRKIHSLY